MKLVSTQLVSARNPSEATLALRFLAETPEEIEFLSRPLSPPSSFPSVEWTAALLRMTPGLQLPAEPISSYSPSIVVSVRPQIDGAASTSQVVAPGETNLFAYALDAIAPDGKLVRLHVPIEVRATLG